MFPSSSFPPLSLFFLLHLCIFTAEARSLTQRNNSISAVFVLGDSTVDSGNNKYIKTAFQSNFPPYGKDFPDHIPTGRFTNGRLVTDFLASHVGIKDFIPPYLDPTLSVEELKTGVCFASAGTGFDPLTAQITNVISIEKQVKYFKEYQSRMERYIGKEKTRNVINNAVVLISCGTNDLIENYYGDVAQTRRQSYSISQYLNFILQLAKQLIQELIELGARKIAFVGLPPIGCVPAVITLNSNNSITERGCIERLSSIARDYNRLLQNLLTTMGTHHRVKFIYGDIYKPIDDMIKMPQQFGFEEVSCGCCGSGLIESAYSCNPFSFLCSDDSKYVFWDAIHPTQAAYYNIFQSVRPLADQLIK